MQPVALGVRFAASAVQMRDRAPIIPAPEIPEDYHETIRTCRLSLGYAQRRDS
jgi:hypothetical protein